MNQRRNFLALGSTFLLSLAGGCLSEGSETEPSNNDSETPENGSDVEIIPPESPNYQVETHTIDREKRFLEHSAEIVEGGLTDQDSPLTLEIELRNTIDESITIGETRRAQFYGARSEDGQFTLKPGIHPEAQDSDGDYEFDEGCWKATEANIGFVGNGDWRVVELEPGEAVTQSLLLLVRKDEDCQPLEEITFSTGISVRETAEDPDSEEEEQYDWEVKLAQ